MYTIHSLIPQKEMRFMEQVFKYVDRMSTRYIDELARLCSMRSVKGDENGLGNARRMIKEKWRKLRKAVKVAAFPTEPAAMRQCLIETDRLT